ncbi:MAG: DNA mismatch repair endonuclease MutL [Clostridia bacterium]|jgi:DNA mismatch repair protein mutL
MGNIVLLDDLTINKIAAGEVIERPASVIKEMVENSIDAGATHVTIEIKNGGISFIRITDNGKGIAKDDVELAFERHATSKIRNADDLDTVKSMGFRGEALASIAAIANVELVSKTETEQIGNRIVVEGGDILSFDEIGCSKGTTITVRNLFFNTPVRYKFLKKDFTESGYIEDVVTRIALVHPEIAIKFINSGKIVLQTNGNGDLTGVIYSIFGKEVANNIINVDYEYEYMKIKGVIGNPTIARSNRSNQIFFVNKRYIKDKTLSSAVEQAFKGMLPIGKFAFLVLDIEMPPSKVDVNVHPAKLEVRFAEESVAFKSMFHAIKDTLLNAGFMTDREKTEEIKKANENAFKIQNASELAAKTYSLATQEQNGNIVEDIYNSRKEENNQTDVKPINSVLENKTVMSNQDIFEKLKSLQDDLKKEVEQNPNLQLTDTYKEMEQKYNEIISPVVEQESKEEKAEVVQEEAELPKALQEEKVNAEILENETIIPIVFDNSDKENEQVLNEDEVSYGANTNVVENNEKTNNEETNEMQNQEIPQNAEIDAKQQPSEKTSPQDSKEKILSFEEMYKELFGKEPYGGRKQPELEKKEEEEAGFYALDDNMEDKNVSIFESNADAQKIQYKFIGIAFNTYIILEIDNELYIMDQHAAHERIMYEKVKKNFFNQTGEKASQLLLLPDIINLTHKEMDIAKDNMAMFRQAGFILEEFGENTIKLSGVPDVCVDLDTEELFKETLDEINTVARTAKQEKEEKFLATVACKAAVKANMQLTKEEVDSLMGELLKLPNPFTCPHGRPTVIKMSKYEIERKFARK